MKAIYFDYAATTPVDREVLKAMLPYFSDEFGNPSSVHSFGQEAITAVDEAREKIAKLLHCDFNEIIFTGSATESNNLAIKGLVVANDSSRNHLRQLGANKTGRKLHIISTAIEHESVHEPLREMEKSGHEATYLKVNKEGFIKISDLEKAIKNNTVLISIIYASNEIGTIQPIKEIGKLLEKLNAKRQEQNLGKIYFHTDAVQAFNYLECRPNWLKVDLLTFSGHKIYGPKGIGALFVRKNPPERLKSFSRAGTPLAPIVLGGGQEFGTRSGTLNVPYIVGLAKAVELVFKNREKYSTHVLGLRNQLLNFIIKYNGNAKLNGAMLNRLPNNLNIRFPGVNNETMLVALDLAGFAVSAGSACSSRFSQVSHVLKAIGLDDTQTKESVRITLGKYNSKKEIKKLAETIDVLSKKFKL